MGLALPNRIELLETAAAKGERALLRQRHLIEELRVDGQLTIDAEECLHRYEASCRALTKKLAALRERGT
jgi:hypothetical protein